MFFKFWLLNDVQYEDYARVHKFITMLITMAILSYIAVAINQKSRGRSLDFKCWINHAVRLCRVAKSVAHRWTKKKEEGKRRIEAEGIEEIRKAQNEITSQMEAAKMVREHSDPWN